jgi:two-component system sensor histidine kinase TorS
VSDRRLINSILVNLIGNAVKFTDQGAVRVSVNFNDEGLFRFEVTDTGIGIAQDQQAQIFERFHKASGLQGEKSGPGLGLTICRDIIEVLDGRIGVVSQVGEGSTFWFEVPNQTNDENPQLMAAAN